MGKGKLVVFLQTNQLTGAKCNPEMTAEEAINIYMRATPDQFPMCIKREGIGRFGIIIDTAWPDFTPREDLLSLLNALEQLGPSKAG